MMLLPLLLSSAAPEADAALNEWRSCVRVSAAAYLQLQQGGRPEEPALLYVEARCWKARASGMLALEPVARAAFADRGVKSPPIDVVGVVVTDMLDGERDKALRAIGA
jgi:hypothetical protein